MDILKQIVAYKREVVKQDSLIYSIADFEKTEHFKREVYSLKQNLLNQKSYGIISEFKRKSPSKGIINASLVVEQVVKGYQEVGASAVSVLTDDKYFGGSNEDFQKARYALQIPLLRKDFIVNEYQVYQTKAMGADIMLLIAAALTAEEQLSLAKKAKQVGLEVLLEIHSLDEIVDEVLDYVDILGVNNRNLKTFETSIENSIAMMESLPKDIVKISESGISSIEDIERLVEVGYKGFLIGEQFMRNDKPEEELRKFIRGAKAHLL